MAFLLRLLLAFLQALPLIISAYSMGVSNASNAEEGTLAARVAGLSVTPLNLIIYGGIAVFVIGQVSGWSLKGFFVWIRGVWASIVQSWKDAAPAPTPPAPTPRPAVALPANAPDTVTLPYTVPATPTPPTP